MTGERLLRVHINTRGIGLVEHGGPEPTRGTWYSLPAEHEEPDVWLSREQAVHAELHPSGSAAQVLRSWSSGTVLPEYVEHDEPADRRSTRDRGAAVVIRDGRMLAIAYAPQKGGHFIPGGGVEQGETPEEAAIRELHEETGLRGTVQRKLATVYNRGRHEHYFLVEATGTKSPAESLDLYPGEVLTWIDIAALPTTAIWPRRLAWRIAYWHRAGWPSRPAVLEDSLESGLTECAW